MKEIVWRRRGLVLIAAVAVALLCAVPAHAATGTSAYSYNRPSITEFSGGDYIAWADTTSAGHVNVGALSPNGSIGTVWTDPTSSTFNGSGPTIAASNGVLVVAWLDSALGCDGGKAPCLQLAEVATNSGQVFACQTLFENSGFDTPYLTSAGDNGTGPLYLTTVDGTGHMHIDTLTVPRPGPGCQIGLSRVDLITSDTSWDGPAMVASGYGTGSEHFWLMWAGTDSSHHLNIAEYDSNWNFIAKNTETNHATLTDMGAAYATGYGDVWMSYCGTNNGVYYQFFTSVGGGQEFQEPGASCDVNYYQGFYSGGVGVNFEYTDGSMHLSWADKTSHQVLVAVH